MAAAARAQFEEPETPSTGPPVASHSSPAVPPAVLCALASALVGAAGIVAYHAGWPLLLTWHSGFTPLHYNTAVLLLLAGASLAAVVVDKRVLGGGLALLVAVFAAAIAGNELFSLRLGLNSALFPMAAAPPALAPTRVAPNTAAALLAGGLGIFLAALLSRFRAAVTSAGGTLVSVLAAVSAAGYAFSISSAYRWREYTPMSLPATVALALLGAGLLAAGRGQTRRDRWPGPSLLTMILAIALPTVSFLLWQALDWQRDQAQSRSALPEIVLIISLAMSALAVLSLFLAQVARERRQALEKTQETVLAERRRLHNAMDLLPAYVVLLTPDYRVPFANRFFEERFGKSGGRRCYEYLFQRDSPCENCETYTVAKTRAYHHWEWTGPDGRNYDIHDFPFTDHDGSPLIMEVGLDVTEQKQSQSKLRASEERYRSLAIATSQVVWTTDDQGLVRGAMPSWTEFTGRSEDQYQGWGWLDDVHPDDRLRASAAWRQAIADRSFYEIEYRLRRKDGEYRYVWVRGMPLMASDGSIREWIGTCTDITERKSMAQQLEERHFYNRSLLEASLDSLVTISAQGKLTDVNRATEEVTGRSREQLVGSDFCDSFTDPEQARKGYHTVFAEGRVKDYPLAIRHTSGRVTEVLYNATLYRNRAGEVQGVFAAARDITERKLAEHKLQQYAAELERSNAELQDFASIASHDLQEPLRKVLAFGDRLHEHCGAGLDETGQDYLRRMQNAAGRMSQLIESLLQYSRVTSRAQPFQRVDLAQVMFEVLGDLEERIREASAKLSWDVLPIVTADRTQMRQLLQNLLANALKFQPPGQRPEVEVRARARPGAAGVHQEWEISVRDNGIGFDQQYAERIFRPFQRLHGRQEYAGSGIGLAICRKIVQRHGGELAAHSAPGAGSTFVITLPAHAQERSEPWSADRNASSSSPKMTTTITC